MSKRVYLRPESWENTGLQAIGYIWITDKQAADAASLEAEANSIKQFVTVSAVNYNLASIDYDEGQSGSSITNRPELLKAIKAATKGTTLIIVSRRQLPRSLRDSLRQDLNKVGAQLVPLSDKTVWDKIGDWAGNHPQTALAFCFAAFVVVGVPMMMIWESFKSFITPFVKSHQWAVLLGSMAVAVAALLWVMTRPRDRGTPLSDREMMTILSLFAANLGLLFTAFGLIFG